MENSYSNNNISTPLLWSQLTEKELDAHLQKGGDSALLPVGATEQHGPHLITGTDSLIAEKLCYEVSSRTNTLVLPTLPYGCSLGHSFKWNGTLSLEPKALIEIVAQIGGAFWKHGFRRLYIVNGHVTNHAPLRCALELLRSRHDGMMVALLDTARLDEEISGCHHDDAEDWHANRAETSLVMHISEDSVREDLRHSSDDPDRTDGLVFSHPVNRTSENGVTGKPSQSSKDEGNELWSKMVARLEDLVLRGNIEEAPLNSPYHRKKN